MWLLIVVSTQAYSVLELTPTSPRLVLNLAEHVHIMSPLEFCAFGALQTFRRVEYLGTADTCCVYLVCSYLSSVVTFDFAYGTQDANGRDLNQAQGPSVHEELFDYKGYTSIVPCQQLSL